MNKPIPLHAITEIKVGKTIPETNRLLSEGWQIIAWNYEGELDEDGTLVNRNFCPVMAHHNTGNHAQQNTAEAA